MSADMGALVGLGTLLGLSRKWWRGRLLSAQEPSESVTPRLEVQVVGPEAQDLSVHCEFLLLNSDVDY